MDTVPGATLKEQITQLVANIDKVQQIDELQSHRFGPYLVINITICVDGNLSVREGDQVATTVEEEIFKHIEFVRKVHIHYHPCD